MSNDERDPSYSTTDERIRPRLKAVLRIHLYTDTAIHDYTYESHTHPLFGTSFQDMQVHRQTHNHASTDSTSHAQCNILHQDHRGCHEC